MKHEPLIDSESPEETLAEFVRHVVTSLGVGARVELGTFSGKTADVSLVEGHCLLKVTLSRILDSSGNPQELWCRLFAPAGIWVIPQSVTEMLCIHAEGTDLVPGSGWCMHGAQLPPEVVSQAVSRWSLPDGTTMAASAGGWVFKGGHASVPMISIDRTSGQMLIGYKDGTHIALDPSGVIELVVTDGASPATVKSALRLDRTAVSLSSGGKVSAKWDGTTGSFTSIGLDGYYLAHTGGMLGPAGTNFLAMMVGGVAVPSLFWKIAG